MIGRNKFYGNVMHGYAGHIPSPPEDYDIRHLPTVSKMTTVPGYAGHVPKFVSENFHGLSFARTVKALQSAPVEELNLRETVFQTSYRPPAELSLPPRSAEPPNFKSSYLKPTAPEMQTLVDRHKKLQQPPGASQLTNRQNEAVATELLEEFLAKKVDMQKPAKEQKMRKNIDFSECETFFGKAIAGYAGHQRQLVAANVFGKSYQESIRQAAEAVKENARQRDVMIDNFLSANLPRKREGPRPL